MSNVVPQQSSASTSQPAWAEKLPENCPPVMAKPPDNIALFRLVDSFPPSKSDFHSQRKLFPKRHFDDQCIARALSMTDKDASCLKLMRKFPAFKKKLIIKIVLPPHAGRILRTGQTHHYSWWRVQSFDPIPLAERVSDV